ncbi:MAG: glycoside hydrolase family 2 TIM barrel-domain containing protein [Bacteroidota bacterium]
MKTSIHKIIITLVLIITLPFISLSRDVTPINTGWEFVKSTTTIDTITSVSGWQQVTIPHTWNNMDAQSGNGFYAGTAWYRRKLDIGADSINKRFYLKFEGVGQVADIYINGKLAGNHKGSYSAFCFDITRLVKHKGDNWLYVRVNNETNPALLPVENFLFTTFGGIYRPVSFITTEDVHITLLDNGASGVYIRQKDVSYDAATINISTKIENNTHFTKDLQLRTSIIDAKGNKVSETIMPYSVNPAGIRSYSTEHKLTKPHLWNAKEDPYLYNVTISLIYDGKVIDELNQPLGVRSFSIDKQKGFILNGKPYRLYGVSRHQERENYGNALTNEQHLEDMKLIMEVGATSIRFAHYQQADYMYHLCDSLGIVCWAEIPFVGKWTGQETENAKQQLVELIRQNFNHPSIYVWGLHNEVGVPEGLFSGQLTVILNDVAKTEDPDRYTVSVTNQWWIKDHPVHYHADLQACNQYDGWYGGKVYGLDKFINNWYKSTPDIPICISEYGAEGNPVHQTADTTPPKPLGPFFPETYQTFYHERTWAILNKHPEVWASYIWNMFDFVCPLWDRGSMKGRNQKGLITYDRKLKKDCFYWYKANWSKEPVLYITGRRFNERDSLTDNFTVYSNLGKPTLEVNGKRLAEPTEGLTPVHYIWHNVKLRKGKNKIKTYAKLNGKMITDSYEIVVR